MAFMTRRMSFNQKMTIRQSTAVMLAAGLAFAMAGCSKDKTLDEWKRERTAEEVAKIEAVSGSYSGTLASTGERMTIELRAGTRITSAIAGASSDRQGTLQGRVMLEGSQLTLLTFDEGFYDVDAHDFKIEIPVTQRNGTQAVVEISGNANGGELNGRIEARGFSELSRGFRLVRIDAASASSSASRARVASTGSGASPLPTKLLNFSGTVKNSRGESFPAELIIMSPRTTTEQLFLDHFTPVEWIDLTFSVDGAPVLISNAQWDHRRGIVSGERSSQSVTEPTSMVVECAENLTLAADGSVLDCRYILNRVGVLYQGRFQRIQGLDVRGDAQ